MDIVVLAINAPWYILKSIKCAQSVINGQKLLFLKYLAHSINTILLSIYIILSLNLILLYNLIIIAIIIFFVKIRLFIINIISIGTIIICIKDFYFA